MRRRLGILDQVAPSTKATAVAAYSFRLLTVSYMGPCVKIRRATDNLEKDFFANTTGDLGELYMGRGQSLKEWLNGAVGFVRTWYDQTGRAKHVQQATAASQPTVVLSNTKGNGVYFNNQTALAGPNVFDTESVVDMHIVTATREIVRIINFLINLNGTNQNNPGRFTAHLPWSDGTIYFDPGSVTSDRSSTPAGFISIGTKMIFSGYKSSADIENGFRVNKSMRYLSSGFTEAPITGGINLGSLQGFSANHHIYALVVFNTKLSPTDELLVENNIAPFA
jgi:hypothetical protein